MRARILAILNERVASPNEIAEMIDERLPNVSYHVRPCWTSAASNSSTPAQRRGAIEHYYRAVVRPFFTESDWKRIPKSGRQAISDTLLHGIWDDVSGAIEAGAFDSRTDRHLAHTPMLLDEQGWSELARVMTRTLGEVEKIQSQSARRLKKSEDAGVPTSVVLMQFETPSDDSG
jgi:hypothetical protein